MRIGTSIQEGGTIMFDSLSAAEPDKILALIGMFRDDPRPEKIDLGVGVYKDRKGRTPLLGAVCEAERRLLEGQVSKSYLDLAGDIAFNDAMVRLVLGQGVDRTRVRAGQAAGGSGALRVIAELLQRSRPEAIVWLSDPTWANHQPVVEAAGLKAGYYPYFDPANGQVCFERMVEALRRAPAGDVVLLHGCCHNPTGANLCCDQWTVIADLLVERGLFPFVDIAYQGFGDGLDQDAAGVRLLAAKLPEMAIAASCSKNFAVYRDRVGVAVLMGRTPKEADVAAGQMMAVTRRLYSMPPDHGAAAVRIVLEDEALRADWQKELDGMRTRMLGLRTGFADALRRQFNSDRFDFLAEHRGMFSRLGLSPAEVERLRIEHAVYMVGDSRINIAGLPDDRLDQLAAAIIAVAE